MLKIFEIFNFQSHKHSIFEFDKGVNIINGTTDAGKSAVLRALKWLIFNRPSGDAFKSHWGGDTSVKLILKDGTEIIRSKGSKDLYKLNDIEFKSFGTQVPEEIQKALNIDDINVQEQINQYFLLTETSGYVASYFNKLANIEQIDIGLASVKKELLQVKHTIKTNKNEIKNKDTLLIEFEYLINLKEDINLLEVWELQASEISISYESLLNLLNEISAIKELLKNSKTYNELSIEIDKTLKIIKEQKTIQSTINNLSTLNEQIKNTAKIIDDNKAIEKIEKEIKETLNIFNQQKSIQAEFDSLTNLRERITLTERKLKISEENYLKKHNAFHKEMKELKICPLCENPIRK